MTGCIYLTPPRSPMQPVAAEVAQIIHRKPHDCAVSHTVQMASHSSAEGYGERWQFEASNLTECLSLSTLSHFRRRTHACHFHSILSLIFILSFTFDQTFVSNFNFPTFQLNFLIFFLTFQFLTFPI